MTSFIFSVENIEPAPQGSKRHIGGGRMIEVCKRVKILAKICRKCEGDEEAVSTTSSFSTSVSFEFSSDKLISSCNDKGSSSTFWSQN